MATIVDSSSPSGRFQVLSFEQVERLDQVLKDPISVHGRGNFPTLDIELLDLVNILREKLEKDGVPVRGIRLNGGAASYVLCSGEEQQSYNDLDLIFGVDLSNPGSMDVIKEAVFESLLKFLPDGVNKDRIGACTMQDAYVDKMVKISNDNDRWSLISLANHLGKNIELKFVDRMRRQFEFSVDSFQIVLDSLLFFYKLSQVPMNCHFFPTVMGESVFGNFHEALYHLNHKLIATRNPEEIRGGGLLKYCNLLVRDYNPASHAEIKQLERYMCSRFFIDFSELPQQRKQLDSYLTAHFSSDDVSKYEYLVTLRRIVDSSTVCLMMHERRQTLKLITDLAQEVQCKLAFQQQRRWHNNNSNRPTNLYNALPFMQQQYIPMFALDHQGYSYHTNTYYIPQHHQQQNHHHNSHHQPHHRAGKNLGTNNKWSCAY